MATPYSDPNLYFRLAPVQSVNWDLAFKALEYKQGQYDTNKLRVDTMLQNYLSTDIIKPEAKQRFVNNIQNLVNEINATGRTDFSDKNISNRVMAHIGQALDAPTVSAIAASKQYRQQEAFLQELLTKKPDLYHKNNHEDMYRAKGPGNTGSFYDWLYDGDATSTYSGTLQYTPYIDLDKKEKDIVMQMMKLHKDTVIEIPDPNIQGRTIKKKISGLTREELRGIAENMFSQEDMQQLAINQREAYGWFETPESIQLLRENAQRYYKGVEDIQDAKITELQLKLQQATPGTSKYQEIEREIEVYTDAKNNIIRTLEDINTTNSIEQLGNYATRLGREQYTQRVIDKYSPMYRELTVGYGVDEYYKWSREFDLKQKTYDLAVAKEQRESREQTLVDSGTMGVIPIPTDTVDNLDKEAAITQKHTTLRNNVQQTSTAYLLNLEDIQTNPGDFSPQQVEEASLINNLYLFNLKAEATKLGLNVDLTKPLSEIAKEIDPNGEILYGIVTTAGGLNLTTGLSRDGSTVVLDFVESADRFSREYKAYAELEQQARAELYNEDQTPLLQEISSGQYQFFTEDGRVLDLKQELIREGVLDANGNPVPGAKLSDSKWAKDVERSFAAGKIFRRADGLDALTFGLYDTELTTIASSFGESVNDITETQEVWAGGQSGATVQRRVVNPNSKTGQYLLNANNNYQDRTWVGAMLGSPKTSLAGDGRFSSLFYGNKDYRDTQIYRQGIDNLYGNLETAREIYITSDDPIMKRGSFVALVRSLGVKVDTSDTELFLRKINENEIEVSQTQKVGSGDKATTEKVPLGVVNLHQISSAAPEVLQRINMDYKEVEYGFDQIGATTQPSAPIKFWNDNVSRQMIWATSTKLGSAADEHKFKTTTAVDGMLTPEVDPDTYVAISDMVVNEIDPNLVTRLPLVLENADRFQIEAKLQRNPSGGYYTEIRLVELSTNNTIYQTELPSEQNLDNIMFKLKQTPQVLFYDIATSIIKDNYIKALKQMPFGTHINYATPAYNKVIKLQ